MSTVTLNKKTYTFETLTHRPETIAWAELSPYAHKVLNFCRQWLSGQETFTIHSSGSTGEPKAITLNRAQMRASARLTGQALGLQAGDRALVCLPVEYIAGMMMLVRGFELGLRLTVSEPVSNPLAGYAFDTAFDFTALVPLQLHHILSDTPQKRPLLNRMQAILVGGGPVSLALLNDLQTITAPVYHTYGMTETATHVALKRLNGPERSDYFTPLPGVSLGLDERGCLTIRAAVTNGEMVVTNDLVDLHADGRFKWLGRSDHVINSGGVKVQTETVEAALERVFYDYQDGRLARRRFFVGPLPDERLGQRVAAIIEGPPFAPETIDEVRAALLKSLSRYAVPRHFYFTDRLLETPTGKIDRLANLEAVIKRV